MALEAWQEQFKKKKVITLIQGKHYRHKDDLDKAIFLVTKDRSKSMNQHVS